MPLLSYNCLNKLNLCPMHLFRFQRTWFYLVDQGRPRLGYQTMSTIKGTLRHSKKGFRWRKKGRVERFKRYILRALRAEQGKGKKKKRDKTRESQGVGIRPISLRLFKISLTLQRNICQNMHTSYITLSHKILLAYLSWKAMPKQSHLDLSSKSHSLVQKH